MWRTIIFLIFTLLVVPVLTFFFDEPLNAHQIEVLRILLYVYAAAAIGTFVISSITKNYSQVDKLWSIIPIPYLWIIAFHSNFEPRILMMALLVTIWGLRLSYNFARRGGFSWKFWEGEEDYRWAVLRAKPELNAGWKWMLFNLFFISIYQLGLILLFCLPALKAMDGGALSWIDFVLGAAILGLIIMETIADQQQYNYMEEKHRQKKTGKIDDYHSVGFTHTGLWAYMRHPNYAAEQAIWVVFYLFSVTATGHWINWSIAGCLLLVLLFKGSSDFSEEISKGKYPLYERYLKKVGRFLPIKGKFKV